MAKETSQNRRIRIVTERAVQQPFKFEWETYDPYAFMILPPERIRANYRLPMMFNPSTNVRGKSMPTSQPVPSHGPWIVPGSTFYPKKTYPLQARDLHRRFASLDLSEDAVLAFYNEWGNLGRTNWQVECDEKNASFVGERLYETRSHILKLRRLIDLWDARAGGKDAIGAHLDLDTTFSFDDDGGVWTSILQDTTPVLRQPTCDVEFDKIESFRFSWVPVRSATHHKEEVNGLPTTHGYKAVRILSPEEFAKRVVLEQINLELIEGAFPAITGNRSEPFQLVPKDLLGALYLLFANDTMNGTPPMRPCACGCGTWFHPSTGQQRYVSDRHRHKRFNQEARKKPAKPT